MLPREIEVSRSSDETRFDLPRRPIGLLRLFGLVPMAFAVVFVWMPGTQIVRFLKQFYSGSGSPMEWFVIAFLSVFVIAAMMPFGFGLFILAGRTRVTLRKDRMVVTELAGPARWSRRMRFDSIERLEIAGAASTGGRPGGTFSALCGVSAIFKNGKKTPVAAGYPRDWLEPLLEEMSGWMRLHGATVPVIEGKMAASVEGAPVQSEARLEKPAGSNIELSSKGWGVEFKVPSRGLVKESHGLVVFGGIWCAIVSVIGILILTGSGHGGGVPLVLFLGVGLAMFLPGVHLGTRRWMFQADRSQLRVVMQSALRSREWKWTAAEVEDVRVGNSNTSVNEQRLEQLQVVTRPGGAKCGMLTGRTHDELAWVATTLRVTLGVQTGESPEAPPRIDRAGRQA